jgi:hypothetical protein
MVSAGTVQTAFSKSISFHHASGVFRHKKRPPVPEAASNPNGERSETPHKRCHTPCANASERRCKKAIFDCSLLIVFRSSYMENPHTDGFGKIVASVIQMGRLR